jgi:hypothetical protein
LKAQLSNGKAETLLLLEEGICILSMMHATQMLLEVVQSGPSLVGPWAILPKTQIHHLRSAFGLFIVNAFLVAGQVVDRTEAFLAWAVRLVTLEQFTVSGLVFPGTWD